MWGRPASPPPRRSCPEGSRGDERKGRGGSGLKHTTAIHYYPGLKEMAFLLPPGFPHSVQSRKCLSNDSNLGGHDQLFFPFFFFNPEAS